MSFEIAPPTSDGLVYHPQVPDSLLIFIIVATVIFISVAMALIVFTVALRKHKYVNCLFVIAIL